MEKFLLKEVLEPEIINELELIGFDSGYKFIAAKKFCYKNLKIYGLNIPQANILKQTALSVGADCATHRDVITGKADLTDVILGGSYAQLIKIAEKLKKQPFSLNILAQSITEFIEPHKRETKIAGILNITPDSFSDGGLYFKTQDAEKHLLQLISDGADLIDIGAETTKPYSAAIPAEEQIRRLEPILTFIQKENIAIPISVDTRDSKVAEFVLDKGVSIINDVSGFDFDSKLPEVVAKYKAGVIIQHSKGTPENMQNHPVYENIVEEIFLKLKSKIEYAESLGIQNIIADPGIGFGKTKEHNFEILNRIEEFYALNYPIMVGVSRKSLLEVKNDDNALKDVLTAALSYPLCRKGIDYLRVHNVKIHKSMLRLV